MPAFIVEIFLVAKSPSVETVDDELFYFIIDLVALYPVKEQGEVKLFVVDTGIQAAQQFGIGVADDSTVCVINFSVVIVIYKDGYRRVWHWG